jgi:hypothetical protein
MSFSVTDPAARWMGDSEPVEVEEISHKDETELSPKDLISRSFEEPNNDGSPAAASAGFRVH